VDALVLSFLDKPRSTSVEKGSPDDLLGFRFRQMIAALEFSERSGVNAVVPLIAYPKSSGKFESNLF